MPVLWLKAGAHGACPSLSDENLDMLILPENKMAILINERHYPKFEEELSKYSEIKVLFLITDSDAGYREMISNHHDKDTYQLYRDYLDNFRINVRR